MARRNLVIADGQVATTSTEITTGPSDEGGRVNVTFHNTGTADETLVLTLTRSGGTARRIKRVVLAENESCEICGLPLNGTDSLKGSTTTASVVDYTVSVGPDDSPLTFALYDANGVPRNVSDILEQLIQVLS